jgi:hypothetical protein
MRCSRCSAPVKPVVAVDIDGTLADYHSHFLRFAAAYLGMSDTDRILVGSYHGGEPFKEWWMATWSQDERTWKDIKLAYRQGAQKRSMPVYDRAAWLTNLIRVCGAELWIATTRPFLRLDNIDPDTREWLDRNRIVYDYMISDVDNKYDHLAQLVDSERVVAVLDDLPEQLFAADRLFGWKVPILRRTRWNSDALAAVRGVDTLLQARLPIVERIEQWKETHEGNHPRS